MKNKIIIFLFLLPLWVVSCGKEQEQADEYVYLSLYPELDFEIVESGAQTKAPITSQYNTYGINVSKSSGVQGDPNERYYPYYYNIQYYYSGSIGNNQFYYNSQYVYGRLPLFRAYGKAKIAAWYPYASTVTDVRAMPFNANSISSPDYLWAPSIEVDPEVSSTLSQSMAFRHVMTCLSFRIATNNLGTGETGKQSMYLSKIVATTKDGEEWIPQTGTFNGITGEVDVDTYVSRLEYTVNTTLSNSGTTTIDLIFPAIPATSGGGNRIVNYELYVRSGSSTTVTVVPIVGDFDLDLGKVVNTASEYGFRAGYRYYVDVRLDNFTKFNFDSIPDSQVWTDNTVNIEI